MNQQVQFRGFDSSTYNPFRNPTIPADNILHFDINHTHNNNTRARQNVITLKMSVLSKMYRVGGAEPLEREGEGVREHGEQRSPASSDNKKMQRSMNICVGLKNLVALVVAACLLVHYGARLSSWGRPQSLEEEAMRETIGERRGARDDLGAREEWAAKTGVGRREDLKSTRDAGMVRELRVLRRRLAAETKTLDATRRKLRAVEARAAKELKGFQAREQARENDTNTCLAKNKKFAQISLFVSVTCFLVVVVIVGVACATGQGMGKGMGKRVRPRGTSATVPARQTRQTRQTAMAPAGRALNYKTGGDDDNERDAGGDGAEPPLLALPIPSDGPIDGDRCDRLPPGGPDSALTGQYRPPSGIPSGVAEAVFFDSSYSSKY